MASELPNFEQDSTEFDYMLLGRYVMDLEYYFGYGNKCAKHLFFDTIEEHIEEVEKHYNALEPKPEWFTEKDLNEWKQKVANSLG